MFPEPSGKEQILIIDDDVDTITLVQHALRNADYSTIPSTSGEDALDKIYQLGLPHLAIVDYHMSSGMNGFEFCDQVLQYCDLPIVMLTVVDAEGTIVEAIERYAEDYIVKPFNPTELVSRIRRVLARLGVFPYPTLPLVSIDEHLQVYFARRQLVFEEQRSTTLTPTEMKLLYTLLRETGQIVQNDYLLRRLWPRELVDDRRLYVHMHRLRRKLNKLQGAMGHEYISSERGAGYRFTPVPRDSQ